MAQTWNERDIPACVYTVLTGNYETLNEQPALKECGLPCICLTDNPQLTSDVWEIRPLNSVFPWDPIRSQRDAKLQPHLYLPEFKASLYIDNALVLKRPPEELLSEFYTANQSVFIEHSFRASLFDEFREIMQTGLDDSARIFEQFNHYKASDISLFEAPLIWTAIMIRDHTADHFEQFCHTWSAHIMRYTRRDQLSVLAALRQSGHAYALKALDNYDSAWHSWPVAPGRKSERRRNGGGLFETEFRLETRRLQGELDSLQLRWDELQAAFDIQSAAHEHLIKKYHDLLDEHRAVISAFENSTSWKVTRPLRTLISLLKR